MIFARLEDFYEKAAACTRLDRAAELDAYRRMKRGDAAARQELLESYLPMTAGFVRRSREPSLGLALACVSALERAADSFDFLQESETFTHRLSWYLRNAAAKWLVRGDD
ncbi:MAG: hypothetical protein IIY16_02895 [Oscillospiraceae bacterium]|nr:hypothetical protein [Oscillospiraceae bacterium]